MRNRGRMCVVDSMSKRRYRARTGLATGGLFEGQRLGLQAGRLMLSLAPKCLGWSPSTILTGVGTFHFLSASPTRNLSRTTSFHLTNTRPLSADQPNGQKSAQHLIIPLPDNLGATNCIAANLKNTGHRAPLPIGERWEAQTPTPSYCSGSPSHPAGPSSLLPRPIPLPTYPRCPSHRRHISTSHTLRASPYLLTHRRALSPTTDLSTCAASTLLGSTGRLPSPITMRPPPS